MSLALIARSEGKIHPAVHSDWVLEMRSSKHLPNSLIPEADADLFREAYTPGDMFDEAGGRGAHFALGTRRMIGTGYRRWLGLLSERYPEQLTLPPADRITRERVREYVELLLNEVKPVSAAICVESLYYVAWFANSSADWQWLVRIAARLRSRSVPEDRFARLIPGWFTLDHGIHLMDEALKLPPETGLGREVRYRDGLILALLSCWPLRRRSIAALTVSRHVEVSSNRVHLHLFAEDAKAKRTEVHRVHDRLVPYLHRYLKESRPRLLGGSRHDGLWASREGRPLSPGRLYDAMRLHTRKGFDKPMGLHDFRRAAATFLVTEAPEMVGWIPGMLQHAGAEVGEKHYNIARSIAASRRFTNVVTEARYDLRLRLAVDHPSRELP